MLIPGDGRKIIPMGMKDSLYGILRQVQIHEDKVADASSHDKEMKYLMGAERLMLCVEDWQFQRVNDTADGVNDTADQKQHEAAGGKCIPKLSENQYADPSHGDINDRGKPFGTGDPAGFDDHAHQSDAPDQQQHLQSDLFLQNDKTYWGVGTGNQHKDHHVVNFFKDTQGLSGKIYRVIGSACAVKQDHAAYENAHGDKILAAVGTTCFN